MEVVIKLEKIILVSKSQSLVLQLSIIWLNLKAADYSDHQRESLRLHL